MNTMNEIQQQYTVQELVVMNLQVLVHNHMKQYSHLKTADGIHEYIDILVDYEFESGLNEANHKLYELENALLAWLEGVAKRFPKQYQECAFMFKRFDLATKKKLVDLALRLRD